MSAPKLAPQPAQGVASRSNAPPSTSENSLNGSYSTFDDTSVGSVASSPSQKASRMRLPDRDILPPTSFHSNGLPFRSQRSQKHANWAKTFVSRPELYVRPRSVEEVQKAIVMARKRKRRIVAVGSGHSPSDLTCTSSWVVSLEHMARVVEIETYDNDTQKTQQDPSDGFGLFSEKQPTANLTRYGGRVLVQAGISLGKLNAEMKAHGLTLPNLGSIDVQSLAGSIATATHGSSMYHGLLSQCVRGLRIVLGDTRVLWCSPEEHEDLFRAALVSLGGIGIITELEIELVPAVNIEWEQSLITLDDALSRWNKDLWTQAEYVRCWWMPYTKKMVVWKAAKSNKPVRKADSPSYTGSLGFYVYHALLTVGHFFPRLLPTIEWFVMGMEYGFKPGGKNGGVQEQRVGLLMDCLYSQFVNEWALPLEKGTEAITRLQKWLHGDQEGSNIPFSPKGLWVHAPIEVRVTDGSGSQNSPRALLDPSMANGPTLYLNATLYRPHGLDPPCRERYYEAFEWLMKDLDGRPHWAKNFSTVTKQDLHKMYGKNLERWLDIREDSDPEGTFVGAWHRRIILGNESPALHYEELEVDRRKRWGGGLEWVGRQATPLNE